MFSQEEQLRRVLENFHRKTTDLEKYVFMVALQDRNETLFYRTVVEHVVDMMPIIYTPTVGEACQRFGHLFRRPRGLYVTAADRGSIRDVMRNWPTDAVRVIVATDGERILGLGDLGAHGMGIPIGKLALYTALAGVHPAACLPVMLDVGTDNAALRADPLYTGLLQPRLRGAAYDDFIEEFVTACQDTFPAALLQFEDFATRNAVELLARYRDRVLCFNDDIQGTAAVTLAGLVAALKVTGRPLGEQRLLFYGAGAAATGIADLIVSAMVRSGLDERSARERCWFMDSKGLVVGSRTDLAPHKTPYAHDGEAIAHLTAAIRAVEPTALIGVSGQGGAFTEPAIRGVAAVNQRPIIFALSNPTTKAECTAQEAYQWSDGRAIFASGSPFPPVTWEGKRLVPGQGNNAYIFPGVGLGTLAAGARRMTDAMFLAAAEALSAQVTADMLAHGSVFPPLTAIREVSARIAVAVAEEAFASALATTPRPDDLSAHVRAMMYEPTYESYV